MMRHRRAVMATLLVLLFFVMPGCSAWRAVYDPPHDALSAEEHFDLGRAYESENQADAAEQQYLLATKSLPEAWIALGNLRFAQERYEDAATAFEKAVKALPRNASARNNLAWTLLTLNRDLEQAEALAIEAVNLADASLRPACEDTLKQIRDKRAADGD